jgi:hypothetical protein
MVFEASPKAEFLDSLKQSRPELEIRVIHAGEHSTVNG